MEWKHNKLKQLRVRMRRAIGFPVEIGNLSCDCIVFLESPSKLTSPSQFCWILPRTFQARCDDTIVNGTSRVCIGDIIFRPRYTNQSLRKIRAFFVTYKKESILSSFTPTTYLYFPRDSIVVCLFFRQAPTNTIEKSELDEALRTYLIAE